MKQVVHPKGGLTATIKEGLQQTDRYRDQIGAVEAWLVVFGWHLTITPHHTAGGVITVVTC